MKQKHLEITTYPVLPKGGQHVGIGDPGVRVLHLPTMISASCCSQRSQRENLRVALSMIEWGLAEIGWKDE